MTDYVDLIQKLRNCATEAAPCKTCNMSENPSCSDDLMKQAADAIEELQKELMNLKMLTCCCTEEYYEGSEDG